jgi:flagellar biosynthesis/type III secretory pathway protein FliH
MSRLKLEVFRTDDLSETDAALQARLEEARSQAFEQGYSAGWEDAVAAERAGQERLGAEIAQHLQEMGFTYQQARVHVLQMIEPMFEQILGKLLPQIARETLAPVLAGILTPLAERSSEAPIRLAVHPQMHARVEARLAEMTTGLPLEVVTDVELGEGQAYLRLGEGELCVDIDRAIATICGELRGFFELSRESDLAPGPVDAERKHG